MSPPRKDYKEVIRLYKLGVPIAEIARRQNPPVSKQTIWNALNRRGLIKHKPGLEKALRDQDGIFPGQRHDSDDN